jgi:hypothetical protein
MRKIFTLRLSENIAILLIYKARKAQFRVFLLFIIIRCSYILTSFRMKFSQDFRALPSSSFSSDRDYRYFGC